MKPLHLLILEVPPAVADVAAGAPRVAAWAEEAALADAALASLLTAAPVSRHGALAATELTPDGQQLRLAPRHRLMCPPLWERVPRAVAVGLPWSGGSTPDGCCIVTPDFAAPRLAHAAALPDRVHPPSLGPQLAPCRLAPDELDDATLLDLGCAAPAAREALVAPLSLHAMATRLLEDNAPPLAVVRLPFARVAPTAPQRTRAFLEAIVGRYAALAAGATALTLIRVFHPDRVQNTLHADSPDVRADSALALGERIAERLNALQLFPPLPEDHWRQVEARYRSPASTLPGTRHLIAQLQRQVDAARARLAPHSER